MQFGYKNYDIGLYSSGRRKGLEMANHNKDKNSMKKPPVVTVRLVDYTRTFSNKPVYEYLFEDVMGFRWKLDSESLHKKEEYYIYNFVPDEMREAYSNGELIDSSRLTKGLFFHIYNATICKNGSVRYKRDSITFEQEHKQFEEAYKYNLKAKLLKLGRVRIINRKAIYTAQPDCIDAVIPAVVDMIGMPTLRSGGQAFERSRQVQSIKILAPLSTLPDRFAIGLPVKEILLPPTLTSIGKMALSNTKLTSIVFPPKLSRISQAAFSLNKELESVEFTGPLKYIGKGAFACCSNLKRMRLPNGLNEIDEYTFISCPQLRELFIPKSVKKVSKLMLNASINIRSDTDTHNVRIKAPAHLKEDMDKLRSMNPTIIVKYY